MRADDGRLLPWLIAGLAAVDQIADAVPAAATGHEIEAAWRLCVAAGAFVAAAVIEILKVRAEAS